MFAERSSCTESLFQFPPNAGVWCGGDGAEERAFTINRLVITAMAYALEIFLKPVTCAVDCQIGPVRIVQAREGRRGRDAKRFACGLAELRTGA